MQLQDTSWARHSTIGPNVDARGLTKSGASEREVSEMITQEK